jgi:hypothetical protein
MHVASQTERTKVETTKNISGRLFAFILKAMSQVMGRVHAHENVHKGVA